MTEHLWSDDRIQQRYDELNRIAPGYPDLNMRDVAREIRDDLQQRIDALEEECERLKQDLEHTRQSLHEWQADYELLSQARDRVTAALETERATFSSLSDDRARWRNMFSEAYSENARLRAMLSDEDVIGAIRTVSRNLAERDTNDEWLPERDVIHVWLERLESESGR